MPYRPGIISAGEDYVGELKALRRKLIARNRQKIAHSYDSEEELIAESDYIDRIKYTEDRLKSQRMAYCLYWAHEKGLEIDLHRQKICWNQCVTCGLCLDNVSSGLQRFRCLCSEGKKFLSPYRILFLNNSIRESWRTSIHEIGVGTIPRKEFKTRPADWQEFTW